ncbi:DUF2156 domain-containing protein [Deferrisoma sp.]
MTRIPAYPAFAPLELGHRDELAPRLRALEPEISEFTFANLYLFRNAHRYEVSRFGEAFLILGRGYDGNAYAFPPIGPPDPEAVGAVVAELRRRGSTPVLFPVPGAWVDARFPPPSWRAAADRDQADYVYRRDDLAHLPGRRYHKRRNRLLKFLREHAEGYVYEELGDEHAGQCLRLAEGWCEIRCSADRPSTFEETRACREALELRDQLGLRGGVIRVGGRVRAFCLGEPLNASTFVVHFEKTEPGWEGLAQVINRDFCLHSLEGYEYVNREQDLGDPGLRQAKEAYHPAFLAEKFRVVPAGGGGGARQGDSPVPGSRERP